MQSWERVEALVCIPNGAGPFPTVLYQHGVGDHKEQLWRWANELAAEGVVTVAFCARSAERFDPPVAAVMETAWVLAAVQSPSRVRKEVRVNNFLIINDIRLEEQLHCRLAVGVGRPLVNRLARAGIA